MSGRTQPQDVANAFASHRENKKGKGWERGPGGNAVKLRGKMVVKNETSILCLIKNMEVRMKKKGQHNKTDRATTKQDM